ncbi:unnamed protein product [Gadus morhua 'NCC']
METWRTDREGAKTTRRAGVRSLPSRGSAASGEESGLNSVKSTASSHMRHCLHPDSSTTTGCALRSAPSPQIKVGGSRAVAGQLWGPAPVNAPHPALWSPATGRR